MKLKRSFFAKKIGERLNRKLEAGRKIMRSMAFKKKRASKGKEAVCKEETEEVKEGCHYSSGHQLLSSTCTTVMPVSIPNSPFASLSGPLQPIFFDLETTDRTIKSAAITQIAAVCGDRKFSTYVIPTKPISSEASLITHLTTKDGLLYHKSNLVNAVSVQTALQCFVEFIQS